MHGLIKTMLTQRKVENLVHWDHRDDSGEGGLILMICTLRDVCFIHLYMESSPLTDGCPTEYLLIQFSPSIDVSSGKATLSLSVCHCMPRGWNGA